MTILAIAPTYDAEGKRDVSRAFLPEAKEFSRMHGARLVQFDNHAPNKKRRAFVHDEILRCYDLHALAIFCHGWMDGIQTGHRRKNVAELAEAIEISCEHRFVDVILYCCSTAQGGAGGDGGFADELRDALCAVGVDDCRVWAHTTKGHTTRNPHVRVFEGDGSAWGGQGGRWVVRPGSKLWLPWRQKLKTDFRLSFWRHEVTTIHRLIAAN